MVDFKVAMYPTPAGSHFTIYSSILRSLSNCAFAPAGDKWGQAKSDAKEGVDKLGDAASEAYDAATTKAQRAGDQAAGKADELGVSRLFTYALFHQSRISLHRDFNDEAHIVH